MRNFYNLDVWQTAHQLTTRIYTATRHFPDEERYGLTSQARRAAVSIPANIAEGSGRSGEAEFARFLHIAAGSASELEYHLRLALDLGYIDANTHASLHEQLIRIKKMLVALTQKIAKSG